MHGLNLGVGQQVCGNVLYLLAVESGIALDKALEDLYNEFCASVPGHQCSTPTFTKAGINGKRGMYPELHIKAKQCEHVLRWLAEQKQARPLEP